MQPIYSFVRNLFKSSVFRYIFVGGSAYALELSALLLLLYVLHVNEPLAISIGFALGLIVSFVLQKIFAFKNKDRTAKTLSRQTAYYALLVIVNYAFTLIFTSALSPVIGVAIARTLSLVITTFWNYIIYKKIIFAGNRR